MIIYYQKQTGEIVGSANGRIHQPEELKMWIGNPDEVGRIIVEWKPSRWYDKDQNIIPNDCLDAGDENGELLINHADFEPDCEKDLKPKILEIEKNPMLLHEKYKIIGGKLREKNKSELDNLKKEKKKQKDNLLKREKKRKDCVAIINDTKKPIEERFNSLLEILNISPFT